MDALQGLFALDCMLGPGMVTEVRQKLEGLILTVLGCCDAGCNPKGAPEYELLGRMLG